MDWKHHHAFGRLGCRVHLRGEVPLQNVADAILSCLEGAAAVLVRKVDPCPSPALLCASCKAAVTKGDRRCRHCKIALRGRTCEDLPASALDLFPLGGKGHLMRGRVAVFRELANAAMRWHCGAESGARAWVDTGPIYDVDHHCREIAYGSGSGGSGGSGGVVQVAWKQVAAATAVPDLEARLLAGVPAPPPPPQDAASRIVMFHYTEQLRSEFPSVYVTHRWVGGARRGHVALTKGGRIYPDISIERAPDGGIVASSPDRGQVCYSSQSGGGMRLALAQLLTLVV